MPRTWLAALAVALLAAVTIFVMLPEDPAEPLTSTDSPLEEQSGPAEVTEVHPPTVASTPDSGSSDRSEIEEAAVVTVPEDEVEVYAGSNGTLVTVIDKESGEPIAGADLYVCLRDEIEENALEMALVSGTETIEGIMKQYGHRFRTNQEGQATVMPLTDWPMLYARLGERSGFAFQIEPGAREVEVQVEPDLAMLVRVVNESGEAVPRAPVSLRMVDSRYQFVIFTRDANEDGELTFDNMRPYMTTMMSEGAHLEFCVGALVDPKDLTEKQRIVLDDEALELGVATLELAETGSVQVRVVDEQGELVQVEGTVQLRNQASQEMGFGPSRGMSRPLVDGVAEFPHVVLGINLEASVFRKNAPSPDTSKGPGPVSRGESVVLHVERATRPIVRARLLDASGQALRDQPIRSQLVVRNGRSSRDRGTTIRTDSEGWVERELEPRPDTDPAEYQRSLRFVFEGEDKSESEAKLDLSHQLRLGINDFGDLKLAPSSVLLRGVVLDQDGNPLVACNVMLERGREGQDELMIRGWRAIGDLQARTDAEGRFVLQGELPEAPGFRLRVQSPHFEDYEEQIQPSGQEVEVRLYPASFLAGSVLVDEGIDPSRFQLIFKRDEHNHDWAQLRSAAGKENEASFEFQAIPDHPYSVAVQSEVGQVLYEQDGVSTQRGETAHPPSFQPLDLRGRLRSIELQVVDAAGQPVDAEFIVRATEGSWNHLRGENGVLNMAIAGEIEEIRVQHPRHTAAILKDVSQSQLVRLEPALEVSLQLPSRFQGLEDITLSVQLYPTDTHRGGFYSSGSRETFDAQGRVTIFAPAPGSYRASVQLNYVDGNRHRSRSISGGKFDISGRGEVHTLQLDADRFDEAIAKLKDNN